MATVKLLRRADVKYQVRPLVARRRVRLVLHHLGAVVVGIDVVAKILDALLSILQLRTAAAAVQQ